MALWNVWDPAPQKNPSACRIPGGGGRRWQRRLHHGGPAQSTATQLNLIQEGDSLEATTSATAVIVSNT